MNNELSESEIAAFPIRRTWYGVAGSEGGTLTPKYLTSSNAEARARAVIQNADYPTLGPWHVVTLTENLRAPQS